MRGSSSLGSHANRDTFSDCHADYRSRTNQARNLPFKEFLAECKLIDLCLELVLNTHNAQQCYCMSLTVQEVNL